MTQEYRNQSFSQRFATLGDTAEGVYLAVTPLGNTTRFGFRRPKGVKFSQIPEFFRHMPDFITPTYLVEVVGLGRDGILKSIKTTKYEALKFWNKTAKEGGLLGVVLFIWNSSEKEFLILGWKDVVAEVAYSKRKHGVQAFESDGNTFYRLDWSRLRDKSTTVGSYNDD